MNIKRVTFRIVQLAFVLLQSLCPTLSTDQCRDRCPVNEYFCDQFLAICRPCDSCTTRVPGCRDVCTKGAATTVTPSHSTTPPKVSLSTEEVLTDITKGVATTETPSTTTPEEVIPRTYTRKVSQSNDKHSAMLVHVEDDPYALHPVLVVGIFLVLVVLACVGYCVCHPEDAERTRDKVLELLGRRNQAHLIREDGGHDGPDREEIVVANEPHLPQPDLLDRSKKSVKQPAAHQPCVSLEDETSPVLPGPSRMHPDTGSINTRGKDSGYPGTATGPLASHLDSGNTVSSMPQSLSSKSYDNHAVHLFVNPIDHELLQCSRPPTCPSSGVRLPKTPDTHRRVQDGSHSRYEITTGASAFSPLAETSHMTDIGESFEWH